jgi:hypothetical protein
MYEVQVVNLAVDLETEEEAKKFMRDMDELLFKYEHVHKGSYYKILKQAATTAKYEPR